MEEKLKPYIEKFKQLSIFKQALITVLVIFILGKIIGSFLSAISGNPAPKEVISQSSTPAQPIVEKMSDKQQLQNLSADSEIEVKYALSCSHKSGDVLRVVSMGEAASLTMNPQNLNLYKEAILALTSSSDSEYKFLLVPHINWKNAGVVNLNRQSLWLYIKENNPMYDDSRRGYQCVTIEDKDGALASLKKDRQAYKDYAEMKKNNDEIEKQNTKEKLIQNQKI